MGSLRKTIHLIHEHEDHTVTWYSRTEAHRYLFGLIILYLDEVLEKDYIIHFIHEHEDHNVTWYLVEQRPTEWFPLRISYDHTRPTFHMKIIIFPFISHKK